MSIRSNVCGCCRGIHTALSDRLCVIGKGLSIVVNGEVVGGVGLSSGRLSKIWFVRQSVLSLYSES
ncbi:hypothetical protein [Amphritea opalescens]|uniref:hypothetical protein n=1 Tax=Amphritea opalescens TaxID=2490544 RepID=UPI0019D1E729|nr:hypothetical protein [Amphritea opalescens]